MRFRLTPRSMTSGIKDTNTRCLIYLFRLFNSEVEICIQYDCSVAPWWLFSVIWEFLVDFEWLLLPQQSLLLRCVPSAVLATVWKQTCCPSLIINTITKIHMKNGHSYLLAIFAVYRPIACMHGRRQDFWSVGATWEQSQEHKGQKASGNRAYVLSTWALWVQLGQGRGTAAPPAPLASPRFAWKSCKAPSPRYTQNILSISWRRCLTTLEYSWCAHQPITSKL